MLNLGPRLSAVLRVTGGKPLQLMVRLDLRTIRPTGARN